MRSTAKRRQHGFTLIELMIVVAIIGLLGAIAIPSFTSYQNRARRSESFTNLGSLAKAQKAYYAEFGLYIGVKMYPVEDSGVAFGPTMRDSQSLLGAFSTVGWYPEGDVFYDYDTETGGFSTCPNSCTSCFTSTAYGDVDGDGKVSMILYTHPNIDMTESCTSLHWAGKGTPQLRGGSTVWDEPVRSVLSDEF